MAAVCPRAADADAASPACLHSVTPRRRSARAAPGPPPLRPLPRAATRALAPAPALPPDRCEACEVADDALAEAGAGAGGACARRTLSAAEARAAVRGSEELPCARTFAARAEPAGAGAAGDSAGARAYVTLPRNRRGVAGALYSRAPLPPHRTTPDGTDIYYWCDAPRPSGTGTHPRTPYRSRRNGRLQVFCLFTHAAHVQKRSPEPTSRRGLFSQDHRHPSPRLQSFPPRVPCYLPLYSRVVCGAELDDGAYNPLWAMRGFTQTFALWKEGRRAQSAPLNAYLTYVTLPWWSIAKGQ